MRRVGTGDAKQHWDKHSHNAPEPTGEAQERKGPSVTVVSLSAMRRHKE